jgi:2-oxoglutarate dehydrogenase E1 component
MRKPITDNFANGTSAVYVDQQYETWKSDPSSVHSSWRAYFENIDGEAQEPYQPPPSIG